jgi:hypothetical protein
MKKKNSPGDLVARMTDTLDHSRLGVTCHLWMAIRIAPDSHIRFV